MSMNLLQVLLPLLLRSQSQQSTIEAAPTEDALLRLLLGSLSNSNNNDLSQTLSLNNLVSSPTAANNTTAIASIQLPEKKYYSGPDSGSSSTQTVTTIEEHNPWDFKASANISLGDSNWDFKSAANFSSGDFKSAANISVGDFKWDFKSAGNVSSGDLKAIANVSLGDFKATVSI